MCVNGSALSVAHGMTGISMQAETFWPRGSRCPFKSRFFGKPELGSRLERACSLLLPTFALPLPLFLPSLGGREKLFRRHDGLRPVFRQEPANGQIVCLDESS